tara:strand:+ start:2123 stop:2488 length:366 start_codon:yes stop_codon:yes gene_type:complete
MKVKDVRNVIPSLKYGIEITRPWSAEMYKHNDEVAKQMRRNLEVALDLAYGQRSRAALGELAEIVNGSRYSADFTIEEIWEETLFALDHRVENWWLNQEYPYAVKKGIVPAVAKEMIGYQN